MAGEKALWACLTTGDGGGDGSTASRSSAGKDEVTTRARSARGSPAAEPKATAAATSGWGLLLIMEVCSVAVGRLSER
jgi:hypothetical protein